ncbi:MAG: hypothetical protein P8R02_00945 [Pseudomonadales bacterium]|nr:hypothetical protein [Pseudomonadales bacterium]
MTKLIGLIAVLVLLGLPSANAKPNKNKSLYAAGHKSSCLVFDELGFDPKQGDSLQFLVDLGFFPPGVDFAVGQLAYGLSTSKQQDPVNGSARLLLSQVWYPVRHKDAKNADTTTHVDFFVSKPEDEALGTALSSIQGVGGAFSYTELDYPNAPSDYGFTLGSDAEVADYVTNAPAGSVEGAPIAKRRKPFPLIILDSPGHEQFGIAEQLARQGYIVVAPVHPNDQLYDGILNIGDPELDGLPIGGIPYGLNCDDALIDAAKPVNGILDFNADIEDVWLADEGIYLGTLDLIGDIQSTLQLRAIDIGLLIERADDLFAENGVVDKNRVGLLGFSLGGNTAQLIVSDDSSLANSSVVPALARAGLDRVDAVVALAGNNRFIGGSSNATQLMKPTMALQGRQDLVVNLESGSSYEAHTLEEPNAVFADNYLNRYAPEVPAIRVLIDRFGHSDFMSSDPLINCFEHGSSTEVPPACVAARPIDERYNLAPAAGGGLEVSGNYVARSLQERLDITNYFTSAWFDLYVKEETCSRSERVTIDGQRLPLRMNNVTRLSDDLFDEGSIKIESRNLAESKKSRKGKGHSKKSSKSKKSGKGKGHSKKSSKSKKSQKKSHKKSHKSPRHSCS